MFKLMSIIQKISQGSSLRLKKGAVRDPIQKASEASVPVQRSIIVSLTKIVVWHKRKISCWRWLKQKCIKRRMALMLIGSRSSFREIYKVLLWAWWMRALYMTLSVKNTFLKQRVEWPPNLPHPPTHIHPPRPEQDTNICLLFLVGSLLTPAGSPSPLFY